MPINDTEKQSNDTDAIAFRIVAFCKRINKSHKVYSKEEIVRQFLEFCKDNNVHIE